MDSFAEQNPGNFDTIPDPSKDPTVNSASTAQVMYEAEQTVLKFVNSSKYRRCGGTDFDVDGYPRDHASTLIHTVQSAGDKLSGELQKMRERDPYGHRKLTRGVLSSSLGDPVYDDPIARAALGDPTSTSVKSKKRSKKPKKSEGTFQETQLSGPGDGSLIK